MNLPQKITKSKKIFFTIAAVLFSLAIGTMSLHYSILANGDNVPSLIKGGGGGSTLFASSGLWESTFVDSIGLTLFTARFEANWTFSVYNGSWVHGYPIWWHVTKVWWSVVSWIQVSTPTWINTGPNAYVGLVKGEYHIGISWLSSSQGFYAKWIVPANSYGTGTYSTGLGQATY